MKVRPFYELAWKNSKDRENYEKQGNFDYVTPFNIWGVYQKSCCPKRERFLREG